MGFDVSEIVLVKMNGTSKIGRIVCIDGNNVSCYLGHTIQIVQFSINEIEHARIDYCIANYLVQIVDRLCGVYFNNSSKMDYNLNELPEVDNAIRENNMVYMYELQNWLNENKTGVYDFKY